MKRFELSLLIGLVVSLLLSSFTAFAEDCEEVRNHMVRLHVLANSDSQEDQLLKLAVRDAVLSGTADVFAHSRDEAKAKECALKNLDRIERIARAELDAQGCSDAVRAELVNMFFDTRTYDGITVPAGQYDAVRIVIGEGKGKNWWCILFPPLCVPAAGGNNGGEIAEQLELLGQVPQYTPKFAVLELVEGIREKLEHPQNEAEKELLKQQG